eukprot:TRINITY_DN13335_c0_g1_i5.p2 TRINITY_DN13335_c0_g1~~TRINITY_DN13335_c0_g1_i5.p2  ORF type:complete len:232 (+),score=66.15 TRINITY_DN13335_c0_g1_i5:1114-1809(+)
MSLNPKDCAFYYLSEKVDLGQSSAQLLHYANSANICRLDMSLPVRFLRAKELLLMEKMSLDIPARVSSASKVNGVLISSPQAIQRRKLQALLCLQPPESDLEEDEILLNEITGTTYKEYEIVKITRHGTRQQRILGLDRNHIYNEHLKNARKFISTIPPEALAKASTVSVPIVNIRDVRKVQRVKDSNIRFTVHCVIEGNGKIFNYEAKRPGDASEIIARLNYLIVNCVNM